MGIFNEGEERSRSVRLFFSHKLWYVKRRQRKEAEIRLFAIYCRREALSKPNLLDGYMAIQRGHSLVRITAKKLRQAHSTFHFCTWSVRIVQKISCTVHDKLRIADP